MQGREIADWPSELVQEPGTFELAAWDAATGGVTSERWVNMLVDSGARPHVWKTGVTAATGEIVDGGPFILGPVGRDSARERAYPSVALPDVEIDDIGGGGGEEAAAPRMSRLPRLLLEPCEKGAQELEPGVHAIFRSWCYRRVAGNGRAHPRVVVGELLEVAVDHGYFDGSGKTMPRPVFIDRRMWASRLLCVSRLLELVLVTCQLLLCVLLKRPRQVANTRPRTVHEHVRLTCFSTRSRSTLHLKRHLQRKHRLIIIGLLHTS